jgi:hypothetical protein
MYMQTSADASPFLFDHSISWTENYRLRACAIASAPDQEIVEPSDDPEGDAAIAQWERDCAAETLRHWESDHADTGEWEPGERHYTPKFIHEARPLSPEDRRRFERLDAWAHAAAVRAFVEFEALQSDQQAETENGERDTNAAAPEAQEREPEKRHDLLLSSWLKLKLPPRDYLLGDIMSTTSRWIIYGETGVGKTLFGMDMSGAIASGRGMLNWAGSGVTRRVMYLDGELPAETFKERMEIVARQYGPDIELYRYCRDILGDDDMPPLNKPEGAKWLERECQLIWPDVIVFDSIMCLLTGNMAEEESWAPITPMLRQISQQRCAQIWLHHTGHDTSKGFGTKTREWQMETVLSLTKDAQNDEHLLMEFKKARLRTPETRAQFEPLKIACCADGWEIVGGVDKRRGPGGDRGAARARAFLEAYDRLAFNAPNNAGFSGKPVKKVALEAVRKEMRSRGALGDSTPGLKMTSAEYKAFDKAKEANTESKRLIEVDGFVWR